MRRDQFEHVIAAAAEVCGEGEIVVIGSQAILGSVREPPASLLFSMEVDVYPLSDPDKAIEIDASLGDGSMFQSTYGYYAHGVGPETVIGPAGWKQRLVRVEVPPRVARSKATVALCLEAHDLVLAKCVAGRPRDWEFTRDALAAELVLADELLGRIEEIPEPPVDRGRLRRMLEGMVARVD